MKTSDENQDKSNILIPEDFFTLTENYGNELCIKVAYEKYLEENVRKIHDRILSNLDATTFDIDERREFRKLISELLYKIGAA